MNAKHALSLVGSAAAVVIIASVSFATLGPTSEGQTSNSPEKKPPLSTPLSTTFPRGNPDYWTPEKMANVEPDPYYR